MIKNEYDKSMILYQRTIVDEVLVQEIDGSIVISSDIGVLKNMSPEQNNTALAEALSMRMQMRESSAKPNVSDKEMIGSIKSRYVQDTTEVQGYLNALGEQVNRDVEAQELDDYAKKLVERNKTSVEPQTTD